MKRNWQREILLPTIVSVGALMLFPVAVSSGKWQGKLTANAARIQPAGAGFRVLMPGSVRERKQNEQYGTSSVVAVTLTSQVGNETYMVVYTTYPPELVRMMEGANPNTLLDFARDKLLKTVSGLRVVNERDTSLRGYPGREVVYDGPGLVFLRAYWALPNFYQVLAMKEKSANQRAPNRGLSRAAYDFIDSFEILSDAGSNFADKEYDPDLPPFLNLDDRLFVGGELLKRGLSADEGGRWFLGIMKRAISYLTPAERDELKLLNDQAYSILSLEEAARFEAIKKRYERGLLPAKEDERLTNDLSRKALESLPPAKLNRYQFLMGKGIRAALTAR